MHIFVHTLYLYVILLFKRIIKPCSNFSVLIYMVDNA